MAADTSLYNPVFYGAVGLGTTVGTDYFTLLRVGAGTPSYANSAGDAYIGGNCEVVGNLRAGGISLAAKLSGVLVLGDAAALDFHAPLAGGGYVHPLVIDTNAYRTIVSGVPLYYRGNAGTKGSGGVWIGSSTDFNANRQAEWWEIPLSTGGGDGGLFGVSNPYGAKAIVVNSILEIEAASTGCEYVNVGVASGSLKSAKNLFSKASAGAQATKPAQKSGATGWAGTAVSASDWFTGTSFSAGVAGTTLSGHLLVELKAV